jgi:hypothetical protein
VECEFHCLPGRAAQCLQPIHSRTKVNPTPADWATPTSRAIGKSLDGRTGRWPGAGIWNGTRSTGPDGWSVSGKGQNRWNACALPAPRKSTPKQGSAGSSGLPHDRHSSPSPLHSERGSTGLPSIA